MKGSAFKLLSHLKLSLMANGVLAFLLIFLALNPVEPIPLIIDQETQRPSRLPTLQRQIVTGNSITEWVSRSVAKAHTYSFDRYQVQLREASSAFTPQGWAGFIQALTRSGALESVVQRKLIVSAAVRDAPVITSATLVQGVETWIVEVPLIITYTSLSQQVQSRALATAIVVRRAVPQEDGNGLAIKSIRVQTTS